MKGDPFLKFLCAGSILANILLGIVIWVLVGKQASAPAAKEIVRIPIWSSPTGGGQDPIDYSKTGLGDDKFSLDDPPKSITLDVPQEVKKSAQEQGSEGGGKID